MSRKEGHNAGHVKDQGQYELFETDHHHQIWALNGKQWYAAVKGQQGDILVQHK